MIPARDENRDAPFFFIHRSNRIVGSFLSIDLSFPRPIVIQVEWISFFFPPLFFSSSLNDSIRRGRGGQARLIIDEKKGGINSIHELGPFLHPPCICVDHTIDACFNGARIRTLAHISSNHVILKRFPDRSRIRSKCGARGSSYFKIGRSTSRNVWPAGSVQASNSNFG